MGEVLAVRTVVVEGDRLRLDFASKTGALTRMEALQAVWQALKGEELGLSFELLVPLPGRRHNLVLGVEQAAPEIETDGAGGAAFTWSEVRSEHGGTHAIRVREVVRLEAGTVELELHIDNRSDRVVEAVRFPILAGLQPPAAGETLAAFSTRYCGGIEWQLQPHFPNHVSYCGLDWPIQEGDPTNIGAPTNPFILIKTADQGLCVSAGSPSTEVVAWQNELQPGYGESMDQWTPTDDDLAGVPSTIRFSAVHLPYLQPGESRTLTPIRLDAYRGSWEKGADLYRRWRESWMGTAPRPSWVEEPHSWQQIQINSPEDELRFRYTELEEVARECSEHGVTAIQLVGWNDGGQDQNNPSHDTDPRLGTAEDLRQAIARSQALGIKIVLFCKFTWADRATQRFRDDLIRFAIKDPYGDYYMHPGYRYQTPTQILDVNTKRLVPMCFLSEEYLELCEAEFAKVLALGPDGILFDEGHHHRPTLLCFDPDHGHRPGASVFANDRVLIQRLARMAAKTGKHFLFAGEACYDWEFEAYHLAYIRSESSAHTPLARYLRPHAPIMTALTGFNDRNMVNQCLRYRYVISYEPYNFKGRLRDFPRTIAYGQRMDALRRECREYLWDGEFAGQQGATVTSEGNPYRDYSVFDGDGGRCVVVVNNDHARPHLVQVAFEDGLQPGRWRLVERVWEDMHGPVTIPPRSAGVFLSARSRRR